MYEMFEQMLAVVRQHGQISMIDLHKAGTYRGAGFAIEGTLENGDGFSLSLDIKERAHDET